LKTDAAPYFVAVASATANSTSSGIVSVAMRTSFTSRASIFLPRYSGVRPTISPAMKTASRTKRSIPYSPEPTPPKTTSPSIMFAIGTAPPRPVSESSAAFTAPVDVTVVIAVHSDEPATPKRVSLPSRLPPAIPAACWATEPWASAA
jgi:hypothetical protein